MEENLKWLWVAFSVAWALHIGYVVLLSGRTKKLEQRLDDLNSQLRDQSTESR